MNIAEFDAIIEQQHPGQNRKEWQYFLEFVDYYFKSRGIQKPIVVELGVRTGRQKIFYERLLGGTHIGIDINDTLSTPDILGDTHDPQTLMRLEDMLKGKAIDLLFIDADHGYDAVKRDFEIYEPLTKHIIAFHDIRTEQVRVSLFWEELLNDNRPWIKMMFYQKILHRPYQYGIGIIVKE